MKKVFKICLGFLVLCIIAGMFSSGGSDSEEPYTTKYLTEQGQEGANRFRENKAEYKEVTHIGFGSDLKEDDLVKMTVVVKDSIDERTTQIYIDYDKTNIQFSIGSTPVGIYFPSIGVDTEFKEGDTITVYGRYNGIRSIRNYECYHIGGHFIEVENYNEEEE